MARKRIGEVLLERGLITPIQLDAALDRQRRGGGRIGAALVALGALSEHDLTRTLSELQGLPLVDPLAERPQPEALALLRPEFCERHGVLPLRLDEVGTRRVLTVAIHDPLDRPTLDAIEFQGRCQVRPLLASATRLRRAIERWLPASAGAERTAQPLARIRIDRVIDLRDVVEGQDEPAVPGAERTVALRRDAPAAPAPAPAAEHACPVEKRFEALAWLLERKGLLTRRELEFVLFGGARGRA